MMRITQSYDSKEDRDGAIASCMDQGMEAGYQKLDAMLGRIQNDLFDLGGELCLPGMEVMKDAQVARLETQAEALNADLPMLKEFILPGGTRAAALAHLSRTVCRRAERSMVRLHAAEPLSEAARRYITRLADLLFILGRALNRAGGRGDVLWQKGKNAA